MKLFVEDFDLLLVPVTMPLYLLPVDFDVLDDEVVIGNFVVVTDFEVLEMLFVFGALGVFVVRGVNDFAVKDFVVVAVLIGTLTVADVVVVDDAVVVGTGFEISPTFLLPGDFDPFVLVFEVDVVVDVVVVEDVVVVAIDVVVMRTVFSTMLLSVFLPPVGFEVLPESFPFLGRETGETIPVRFILDI